MYTCAQQYKMRRRNLLGRVLVASPDCNLGSAPATHPYFRLFQRRRRFQPKHARFMSDKLNLNFVEKKTIHLIKSVWIFFSVLFEVSKCHEEYKRRDNLTRSVKMKFFQAPVYERI